jgi:hypothetical protein
LYRYPESLLLAETFSLLDSKSPIKFDFYPLAAMDFIDEVQKARGVEREFVAAHGTEAVRADAVLDLKQTDPQEMLECAPDSGFSANSRISHEAAIRNRRLARLGVGEGIKDNQDRAVRSGQLRPKASADEPLKGRAVGAYPISGIPLSPFSDVLPWLCCWNGEPFTDPCDRRREVTATDHHY